MSLAIDNFFRGLASAANWRMRAAIPERLAFARHIKAIDSNEALCRVCDDHFNMLFGAGSNGVRRYDEAHAASDDGANSHVEFVILAAISEIQPAAQRDNCSARLLYE